MTRRGFLFSASSFAALVVSGGAAHASVEDKIAARLKREGYRITKRKRTWLGRVRILAVRNREQREVVLDPATGEVLRDYSDFTDETPVTTSHRGSDGRGSSAGSSGGSGSAGNEASEPGSSSGGSGSSGNSTDSEAEESDRAAEEEARERAERARHEEELNG